MFIFTVAALEPACEGWAGLSPLAPERTSVSKTSSLREDLAKRQAVPLLSVCVCVCVCVCVFSDTFEYTLKWNKERMIK